MARSGLFLLLAACAADPPFECPEWDPFATPSNVLLVVFDDVGAGQLGREAVPPITPVLDCLAAAGTRFETVWGAPVCSPGRAQILTGRLPNHTGVTANLHYEAELADAEVTLGDLFRAGGFATGFVGKWHLGGFDSPDGPTDPLSQGFDVFAGTPGNLLSKGNPPPPGTQPAGYSGYWHVSEDGQVAWSRRYVTDQDERDAEAFVDGAGGPWFLTVALHAAHAPLSLPDGRAGRSEAVYDEVLHLADAAIGDLLAHLGPDVLQQTLVIVTADNGTSDDGVPDDEDGEAKGTLSELGLRVPLIIAGPGVRSGVSKRLAHQIDLFRTLEDLFGWTSGAALDGVSLAGELRAEAEPGSERTLVAAFAPRGDGWSAAARDTRFELILDDAGRAAVDARLFDLAVDPSEEFDLLDAPLSAEAVARFGALTAAIGAAVPPPVGR